MIGTVATVSRCVILANMAGNLDFGRVAEWSIATVLKTVHREHRYTPINPQNAAKLGCFRGVATSAERADRRERSGTNRRVGRHNATPYSETKKALLGTTRARPNHQRRSA